MQWTRCLRSTTDFASRWYYAGDVLIVSGLCMFDTVQRIIVP